MNVRDAILRQHANGIISASEAILKLLENGGCSAELARELLADDEAARATSTYPDASGRTPEQLACHAMRLDAFAAR